MPLTTSVLVIEEDSPRVRLLAWALSQKTGFEVVTASPHDAAAPDAMKPDFIVINTQMSLHDKRGWIEAFRYLVPNVLVVDLHTPTSGDDPEGSGADAYLAEPYHVAALIETMLRLKETRAPVPNPGSGVKK